MKISVVIPTMNRRSSLLHTMDEIRKTEVKPDEVIIVDQTQDEEERKKITERLNAIHDLTIRYIYSEILSLTKARNIGLQAASNDIIVCMDDDIELEQHIFRTIKKYFHHQKLALIAGLDEYSRGHNSKLSFLIGTRSWKKRNRGHITKSMLGKYPDYDMINKVVPTEWAMGYFFVVRKSLVEKWKLQWDEKLTGYAYAEDLDFSAQYCECAKKNGMYCILTPKVKVKHLASKEYRIPSKEAIYKYVINRDYIYYKLYRNRFSRLILDYTNVCMLFRKLLLKEGAKEYIGALICSIQCRKYIKQGDLSQITSRYQ